MSNQETPKPKFTFNLMAVNLTVLDQARHNAAYFAPVRTEDSGYVEALVQIMEMNAMLIEPSKVLPFLEANPHLSWLWKNASGEIVPDYLYISNASTSLDV